MSSPNSNSPEVISNNLLVLVGSGLLLIGLVNILHIVIPPRFGQDPLWEINTLGKLVGVSPITIIGICFIFYTESRWISLRLDKQVIRFFFLKNLSYLSLILSLGYLSVLLIASVASANITRLEPTKTSLSPSQTASQPTQENLSNGNINSDNKGASTASRSPSINTDRVNPPISNDLKYQSNTQENLELIQASENNKVFQQIGKWYVEATVSAVVFFGIWHQTGWARNPARPKRKRSSHQSFSASLDEVNNEIQD